MSRIPWLLLFVFLTVGIVDAQVSPSSRPDIYPYLVERFKSVTKEEGDIILLGNSITFWGDWPELTDNHRIRNWGIPGDHTFGLLGRIDDVIAARPSKLFILIGINDLSRGLSDSTLIANYRELVQRVRQGSTNTQLYLQSILPTNPVFEKLKGHYGYEKRIIDLNAQLMELAAHTPNCTYIHLYPHFQDEQGYLKEEYTWDGVHLTVAGYRRWADLLFEQGFLVVDDQESKRTTSMKNTALSDLKKLLYSQERWIKVHVAEFLLWEDYYVTEVRDVYLNENERFSHIPQYRIGIWRVLAQAAENVAERQKWVDKIVAAYQDEQGPDRLHAIETLAKLSHAVIDPVFLEAIDDEPVNSLLLYRLWNLAYHPEVDSQEIINRLLSVLEKEHDNEVNRMVASYILRSFPDIRHQDWERLLRVSEQVHGNVSVKANILASLWITQPASVQTEIVKSVRDGMSTLSKDRSGVNHFLMALAKRSAEADREEIKEAFSRLRDTQVPDYDADLHASAAYAVISGAN